MSGASSQLSAFNYAVQPLGNLQIKNITAAYTVSPSDNNFILNCTGTTSYTISLPPSSSFPSGFNFVIWNNTTTAAMAVTIDPNGAETIDGVATLVLNQGEGTQIVCDGTNWQISNKKTMRGYSDNIISTRVRPVATGSDSIALGKSANASNSNGFAAGNYSRASGLNSLALGSSVASGQNAIGINSPNGTYDVTAGAPNSVAIGLNSSNTGSTTATGSGAMALGGSYASGTDSFAAGVANNTSTYGAQAANAIAIGYQAKATSGHSVAIGGNGGTVASGAGAVALGGTNSLNNGIATASGVGSFACGDSTIASNTASVAIGYGLQASGYGSVAIGMSANSAIRGKYAYASAGFSSFRGGECQYGMVILVRQTADATATVLTVNDTTASTTNQVILPNNSAYAFTGTVVARRQAAGGTESAAWKVEGLIRREANAGTTTLVASTVTAISNVPSWTLALSADTTNGGLAVTATGAASTNIRWVATIQTSEVTYA